MKENRYDDDDFFDRYRRMPRSVEGLEAAGEWHELRKMLPDFRGRRVLDLGCGFGWHCRYAVEQGAESVVGVDISEKMLAAAREKTESPKIRYVCAAMEDVDFPPLSFDVALSSLAFHYVESFIAVCANVYRCLTDGGAFVFSVEHPVFTAYGSQDWICDAQGTRLHWPVDRYFEEGPRRARFLDSEVVKVHRTLTTYVDSLLRTGFAVTGLVEPRPDEAMLKNITGMADELRRPMMLILSAVKR